MDLSVIIPVYNEEESIPSLYRKLKEALGKSAYAYEVIFVDDGSRDQTLSVLKKIRKESANNPPLRIVQLTRNFGQHPALVAGFSVAKGRTLVTIDADLQIDPEHIIPMMDKIAQGFDFVSGIRRGKGDSFWLRRVPSRVLNALIGTVIGKRLLDYGCPLNAMKAEIAEAMRGYGEMQRFLKPLAIRLATRVAEVEVVHSRRTAGRSRYGLLSLVDLFFDFITNFSKQLFQRVAVAGCAVSVLSFLGGIIYLILRFPLGLIQEPYDRLQAIVLIGFLSGIQLLVLGVLGDFVIRIYRQLDFKPIYTIKKIW